MARRVAFLRSKSVGGVEPRLDREARALAAAGYEVHAILWDRDLRFREREDREGYAIHRIRLAAPYNRPALAWKLPRFWRRAFRALRGLRPEIVHAADWDTIPPAMRARRAWGAKVVFDVWDFYADMITARIPWRLRAVVERLEMDAVREGDLVILPDEARRSRLRVEPRRWIEVVNAPEERPLATEPHEGFVVFYGGNLSMDRGLQHLLPACERAGARLLVAGQGPDEAELVSMVRRSAVAEFVGYLSHDQVLRHTADADAIPLLYDPAVAINRMASPNKLFEAMMCSKPVVASDGTTVADLVRSQGIGLVVPYGDVDALAGALRKLIDSPPKRTDLGARGRALYEARYRWDVMRQRLVDAYAQL